MRASGAVSRPLIRQPTHNAGGGEGPATLGCKRKRYPKCQSERGSGRGTYVVSHPHLLALVALFWLFLNIDRRPRTASAGPARLRKPQHTRTRTSPGSMAEKPADPALEPVGASSEEEIVAAVEDGVVVNASGYKDQLRRQYGLLGLAGVALTVDNAWVALGSSISVSIRMSLLLTNDFAADDLADAWNPSQRRTSGSYLWSYRGHLLLHLHWLGLS